MLMRIQRILSAIELFALVLWVGGLFFFGTFGARTILQTLTADRMTAASIIDAMMIRFNRLEIILAIAVLASNFVKVMTFARVVRLQRVALLISALMLAFTVSYTYVLRPRMAEKLTEVRTLAPGAVSPEREEYRQLHQEVGFLIAANIGLGLFMVYAYRNFEERKLQSVARILRG